MSTYVNESLVDQIWEELVDYYSPTFQAASVPELQEELLNSPSTREELHRIYVENPEPQAILDAAGELLVRRLKEKAESLEEKRRLTEELESLDESIRRLEEKNAKLLKSGNKYKSMAMSAQTELGTKKKNLKGFLEKREKYIKKINADPDDERYEKKLDKYVAHVHTLEEELKSEKAKVKYYKKRARVLERELKAERKKNCY